MGAGKGAANGPACGAAIGTMPVRRYPGRSKLVCSTRPIPIKNGPVLRMLHDVRVFILEQSEGTEQQFVAEGTRAIARGCRAPRCPRSRNAPSRGRAVPRSSAGIAGRSPKRPKMKNALSQQCVVRCNRAVRGCIPPRRARGRTTSRAQRERAAAGAMKSVGGGIHEPGMAGVLPKVVGARVSALRCIERERVIRIAGIHKIGTGGAQQSFDLLDRSSNYAARVAGLNLALQLEEASIGALETLRQERGNVNERDRVYPEHAGPHRRRENWRASSAGTSAVCG